MKEIWLLSFFHNNMKKRLAILTIPSLLLLGALTHAATTEQLISFADNAIEQNKITLDKFITIMQTVHETQKVQFLSELDSGQLTQAEQTINQRSQMYPLTSHLYDLKAGSGQVVTLPDGTRYSFKRRANLPWMNITRWAEQYYAFPKQDTFVELQRNVNPSGPTQVDTLLQQGNSHYQPTYFYAGNYTLQDVSRKSLGDGIMEAETQQDLYYFFDVPSGDFAYDIVVTSGSSVVALSDLYELTSYSPEYFLTSLDDGFQFCKQASAFIGTASHRKEYSAQECRDAAQSKFYKEMHPDLLSYATDLYL